MKRYVIRAHVETITFEIEEYKGTGLIVIPPFTVEAKNKAQALLKAREIIDPLQMTGAAISAERAGKKKKKGASDG